MNENIPNHLGIIVDGNRRWAKKHNFSSLIGHTKGAANLKRLALYAQKLGIKIITIYAFSTENWKRSEKEVNGLMNLFENFIDKNINELNKKNVQLRHIGKLDGLSSSLQKKLQSAIALTKNNKEIIFQLALNYGGRDEIKRVIQKIIKKETKIKNITEELISKNLDTSGLPDPDLIIRTSGEQRLSGFLLWQSAYFELYFSKTYWPDFNKKELDKILLDYSGRQRRLGK